MIIVTGGAGFIGSNLVVALNHMGVRDVVIVDDLTMGAKALNINDLLFCDYLDLDHFYDSSTIDKLVAQADAVFHQGANSCTTDWNGKQMMHLNFEYSKRLYHACVKHQIPFLYASSASVYGHSDQFDVALKNERPLNMYAFSKWSFDQYIRCHTHEFSQVVGFRYFNVYGPRESHKGDMASPFTQFAQQLKEHGYVSLFEGSQDIKRDFIHVKDVTSVLLWAWQNKLSSGIYNLGTGDTASFCDVATRITDSIRFIPFPEHLKKAYQYYTCADIKPLRAAGYSDRFTTVHEYSPEHQKVCNVV